MRAASEDESNCESGIANERGLLALFSHRRHGQYNQANEDKQEEDQQAQPHLTQEGPSSKFVPTFVALIEHRAGKLMNGSQSQARPQTTGRIHGVSLSAARNLLGITLRTTVRWLRTHSLANSKTPRPGRSITLHSRLAEPDIRLATEAAIVPRPAGEQTPPQNPSFLPRSTI